MRWLANEWDYRNGQDYTNRRNRQITDTEFIAEAADAIGVGDPNNVPGKWPQRVRQLFQDSDFHIVGNRIFRKVDPVADAYEGNYGFDVIDSDDEDIKMYLEKLFEEQNIHAYMQQFADSEEVQEWFAANQKDILEMQAEQAPSPDDAFNYAQPGLTDVPSNETETDILEKMNGLELSQARHMFELIDTEGLNSPFCGLGYHPPRDRYEWRETQRTGTDWAQKAEERRMHCADLVAEATDLCYEEDINKFYWRIREDYFRDRELWILWSTQSFDMDRSIYMDSLRRQGFDEETIRRKLWFVFDTVACVVPAVKNKKTGATIRRRIVQIDSLWRKARSAAMVELTMTKAQWQRVYDILKERRTWCRTGGSKSSLDAWVNQINEQETEVSLKRLKDKLVSIGQRLSRKDSQILWQQFTRRYKEIVLGMKADHSQKSSTVQTAQQSLPLDKDATAVH